MGVEHFASPFVMALLPLQYGELLRTPRSSAPHAKTRWLEAELPGSMRSFILNLIDTDGILKDHSIGTLEVKKPRARGRMTTRTEDDRHALPR